MKLKTMLRNLLGGTATDSTSAQEDAHVVERLIRAFEEHFKEQGITVTAFHVMRVHDVITQYRLARRIEQELFEKGIVQKEEEKSEVNDNSETQNPAKKTRTMPAKTTTWKLHPAVEALGKAWERFRKAMKELEEACNKDAAKGPLSLADIAGPILEQADGVLEEALAVEEDRQKEACALRARNAELEQLAAR